MIILLYTVEFAISHVNWFSEYRDIASRRSRNSWKSLTNQLALRMGQVVVLPLVFINQSMPCPLPPHSRLNPAGLQKIEVASFGYSQLQTQAVHAGTQDMACSWTGVA